MKTKFPVCRSVVGEHVGARGQSGEESMMVVSRDDFLDDFNRFRDFCAIFFKLHIMQKQVEHVPVPVLITHRAHLVLSLLPPRPGRPSVRLKPLLFSQRHKLIPDDLVMALQLGHPGEFLPFPPGFDGDFGDEVWAAYLAGVVFFRKLSSVYSHKKPLSRSIDIFVL